VSASVHPIRPEPEDWQDLAAVVAKKLPRITPGEYEAVSVTLRRYEAFGRHVLRLELDVYAGSVTDGQAPLARLPWYARLPGSGKTLKPAATSKLGRLLHLAGVPPSRGKTTVSLSVLAHKRWRVRVEDAAHDSENNPLDEANTYSLVTAILERL
jgi:hypothetical protein